MYKYILFDIDGTILNFIAAEEYSIKTLFRKYDLGNCTDEMLAVYSKINRKYWEALERKEMTKQQILVDRFKDFFEIYGLDSSCAEAFNKDYQLTLGDCIVFSANAKDILQLIKGRFRLIASTNGTKTAQIRKLAKSGLNDIFEAVYISEDVGYEKPNKEYFKYIFNNEGITDPDEVLIIGDSLTSDILGGINANIHTCWYNPKGVANTKDIKADYEIRDLIELKSLLGL